MRRLLLALITAGCLLLQVTMARATAVNGTFKVENPDVISVTPDDGECKIVLDEAFDLTGDIVGRMNSHFRIEHMGSCDQPASETFSARGTFTGSVLGTTGSFQYTFEGTIDAQNNAQGPSRSLRLESQPGARPPGAIGRTRISRHSPRTPRQRIRL